MGKGISPLVGYVLAILLAVIVIGTVAFMVASFYDLIIEDEVKRELRQIAAQTSSKVTELYSLGKASKATVTNQTAVLLADSQLNLPSTAAGRQYQVTLLSAAQISSTLHNVTGSNTNISFSGSPQTGKVVAESLQEPFVSVEYDIPNIDVDIQGRSDSPENASLRYYRYNPNGTSLDVVLLGSYSLLGQVMVIG